MFGLPLALVVAVSAPAGAQVTARVAAALASLPDGTKTNVVLSERGSEATQAVHVTRRGPRLTIFDRTVRRYRTFYVVRSGTIVTVLDRATAMRESFVVRSGVVTPRHEGGTGPARQQFITRSSGGWRGVPTVWSRDERSDVARRRAVPVGRAIRDLDVTLDRLQRAPMLGDAIAVSIVLDP